MDSPIYHLEGVIKAKTKEAEDFTGPLDLILHLLSKNKMEIKDIQISLILEQYLKWMDDRRELNLEIASEFVHMASHLIYIKTRMLLSIHDEEAQTEMDQLIAMLESHQRNERYEKIKEIIPRLVQRYDYGQSFLTKEPEPLNPNHSYHYVHEREELGKIILAVLARIDHKLPPPVTAFEGIVGREPYPIAEKADEILKGVISGEITRLKDVFAGSKNRSEVVAAFIAVLELCKGRRLYLTEAENGCMIAVTHEECHTPLDITSDKA